MRERLPNYTGMGVEILVTFELVAISIRMNFTFVTETVCVCVCPQLSCSMGSIELGLNFESV